MKKVLSFVLVLAMILGSVSMVFAGSFPDVEDKDCEGAVNVLSELDIISGYTDGTFKPEKVVTRAEMAALLINALGITPAKTSGTKFSDVPYTHWAAPFVDYAQSLGIISGYTDGTFKPDQTVTYNEAITMVVKALGYRDECLVGTYPASYVNQAMSLGLLDDVQAGTAGAVRGDIAQLIYAAMGEDMVFVSANGYITFTGKTMFDRHGVTKKTNYVIDDEDVADAYNDISDMLGAKATVWVDEDGYIVAVEEVKSETKTDETNNATPATKFGDYKLSKVAGDEVAYFLNGEFVTKAALSLNGNTTYTITGSFSGNYVTDVYSVLTWEADDEFKMTDSMVKKLASDDVLNGHKFAKNNSDEINTSKFTLVGADTLADIKKNDVVTVYENQAGLVCKIEVSDKTETGKVTKIKGNDYTIGGTVYDLEGLTLTDTPTSFSAEYTIYFNYAGDVFDIKVAEADTTDCYAVLIDLYQAAESKNWSSETAATEKQIKVLDADGTENTYVVNEDATAAELASIDFTKKDDLNKVIKYTLDEDNEVVAIEKIFGLSTSPVTITKKGTINGKYINDDAAIFQLVDASKYSWKVVKLADVLDSTLTNGDYKLDDNQRVAVIVSDSTTTTGVYGFFVDKSQVGATKWEATFLVDGEETVYSAKAVGTTADAWLYGKITVSADSITSATDSTLKDSKTVTTGAAIKGNTLLIDDTYDYAIDKDAAIYCYDKSDKKVTVSSLEDLAEVAAGQTVYFYQVDSTATYDVVVFTQE